MARFGKRFLTGTEGHRRNPEGGVASSLVRPEQSLAAVATSRKVECLQILLWDLIEGTASYWLEKTFKTPVLSAFCATVVIKKGLL